MRPAKCPNCGSSQFLRAGPDRWECAYCGTQFVEEREAVTPDEPPLVYRVPVRRRRMSLAAWSIIASVVGLFSVPLLGPIVGLYLGYRALAEARSGGQEQEGLARAAVILGWVVLAASVLPFCFLGGSWVEGLCSSLTESLFKLQW